MLAYISRPRWTSWSTGDEWRVWHPQLYASACVVSKIAGKLFLSPLKIQKYILTCWFPDVFLAYLVGHFPSSKILTYPTKKDLKGVNRRSCCLVALMCLEVAVFSLGKINRSSLRCEGGTVENEGVLVTRTGKGKSCIWSSKNRLNLKCKRGMV